MPALSSNSNRPAAVERKLKRKKQKHPRGQQGPISSTSAAQPGPISDREMAIINKRKRKPKQRVALREARKHGPETGRGTRVGEDKSVTPAQQQAIDNVIRAARIRVLRRRNRGSGVRAIKRELEGTGALADAFDAIGKTGAPAAGEALDFASRGAPRPEKWRTDHYERVRGGTKEALERGVRDLVNMPAQAVPSLYVPAAALFEAAKGDTSRGRELLKTLDETDPVWNTIVAGVEKAQGDSEAARKRLDRASASFLEHPGMALVETAGVTGAVGRASGAVSRSRVSPRGLRRIASTERESRVSPGTGLEQKREYSPDLFRKGRQVLGEKLFGEDGQVKDREIRRRVDEAVGAAEEIARNRSVREDADAADIHDLAEQIAIKDFGVKSAGDLPQLAKDRLQRHRDTRVKAPTVQVGNRVFREVVLSTSPSWAVSNVIEGLARAAVHRAGPRSYITGRQVLKRISPEQAEEVTARLVGGGHAASVKRQRVALGPEVFKGSTVAPVANALGKFWAKPGPKHAAALWHAYTEFAFRSVSGRVESHIQTAMLGRELRKSNLMDGQTVKLSSEAFDQAARGLENTAEQVRFARKIADAYGRYSSFGPEMRLAISTVTPFVAWSLSAVNFVLRVLPRDHPAVTALIASMEQASDEWLEDEGLGPMVENALPGFLQGSIPTGGGAHQRASRFTPFGAFGSPTETVEAQILPQLQSVLAALRGEEWNGRALRIETADGKTRPANELEKAVAAAHAFLQGSVPFLSQGERVADKGLRALDPFKDAAPAKKKPTTLKRKKPKSMQRKPFFDGDDKGSRPFFDTSEREGLFE